MSDRPENGAARAELADKASAPTGSSAERLVLAGLILCFFLSGFAALLYQTAWLRQFSAVFGTSELAVAAVLAAYMGGLAAGAAVAGRIVVLIKRPVLAYGLLEAGIAVSALAVPILLLATQALYGALLGGRATPPDAAAIGQPVFYLLVAFVVLALPTGFMGATLPLLTRHAVRRDAQVGPRVALLYATNTAGAVLGTVLAGFVLLPALGLSRTVWIGVAVNLGVFALAAALARRARLAPATGPDEPDAARRPLGFVSACLAPLLATSVPLKRRLEAALSGQPAWILPLMLVSGANAFFYEVLWTRMLAHVMGGSIYAFATMLAAFLSGIALGAGLAGKVAATRATSARAFALTQLAIAAFSIGVYEWMGPLIPEIQTTRTLAVYAIAVLLPATVFIGATFPLAVRVLARDEREASPVTARVYAWNTVGAILGAVLAGFVLIPALGFEGSIRLAVMINVALALWTAAFVSHRSAALTGVCAVALASVWLIYAPARPQAVVSSSGFALSYPLMPREVFYSVGRSATVMVLEEDGHFFVRTNGLPEATITARGGIPTQQSEKWLGALPVVARPEARSMLVVGLGGGVALEGIPGSVEDIDVVELEPEVVEANRFLAEQRNRDPLADPRVNLVINDARNALRLTEKAYDLIVSQPSHPWTAGASHLFTREFVAESKAHLNTGGAFVQWISAEFLDEALLRTLAATVAAEFEHVRLYQPSPRILVFVASSAPLELERRLAETGQPLATDALHFGYLGINAVEDLLAALVMDGTGLSAISEGAPISTDDDNRMATHSRVRADGLTLNELAALFGPFDPLLDRDSWIHRELSAELDYGYLTRRLLRNGQRARAAALAQAVPDTSSRYLVAGQVFAAAGQSEQARRAFNAALEASSTNAQARFALIEGRLGTLGEALAASVSSALPPSAAAIIEGWSYAAAGDWPSLAQLEAELARTRITDAWYPEAAWLRALWRTNAAQDRERLAADGLRLIDRALVLDPDPRLFALRASSAVALGDPHYIIESFRFLAATMRVRLGASQTPPAQELAALRRNLTRMAEQLRGDVASAAPERAASVLRDIDELAAQIDSPAPP